MITFDFSNTSTDFITRFSPTIKLDRSKNYEASFISLETYNSIPNITSDNNIFKYSTDSGVTWKIITLLKGAYELEAINNEILRQMAINGDSGTDTFYINIDANISTQSSIINITNNNYQVDFTVSNSIGSILGFDNVILTSGYNISPKPVDIIKVNSIRVNVDIIEGSYVDGIPGPTIYSFFPKANPGYKVIERPTYPIFYSVSVYDISYIRVWLTDQNEKPIDLRGETLSIQIALRENKKIK